ncbi:viridiflorene synthase-like [Coffea eugenioides]|uniref:viridiflorene synthase-like n=1 Tax=Coffea eugenioides TaxID=49369 RepID=UPI000F610960|nr:viridiflorene synthase-like [Coffea eugenioides]
MASSETAHHLCNEHEIARPLAYFPENIWSDRIASFTLDKQEHEKYAKEIELLSEEVRRMLLSTENNVMDQLDLIDKVERLGISYHFDNEIEEQLQKIFDECANFEKYQNFDLSTVALQFRLLRQHGFNISCDVFQKFVDADGKFKDSLGKDKRGLLNLYEAAHVRTYGDSILEEALTFATTHLKTCGAQLVDSTLAKQVEHALKQPLHKGIPRLEIRHYISIYEEDESNNKLLLRLAKMDYHWSQMLHKQELCEILRWGKELNIVSKASYSRERYVECYFWALGTFCEPQYSLARIFFSKIVLWISLIDDIYDAYGTVDELKIFTDAAERWDGSETDQLPEYMKTSFMALLKFNEKLGEDSALKQKTNAFNLYVEEWKNYMRTSLTQSKWFLTRELPSFAEYLKIGMVTSTYYLLPAAGFLVMESATDDAVKWLLSNPKLIQGITKHGRMINDVGTHEFEKLRGATAIEIYMKDYNVSEEEAMKKFEDMADDAWKDMNAEFSRPTAVPRDVLLMALNLARICEVIYKNRGDGYTKPRELEAHIIAMLIDSLSV